MPLTRAARRWRARREDVPTVGDLRSYRTPIQVCPRGCEYHEPARRDVIARTSLFGRAVLHGEHKYETINCPECGARLARRCARCKSEIFAPVVDRCTFCGLPQPWAAERRAGAERASLRLWRPEEDDDVAPDATPARRANDPARLLYTVAGRGELWAIEGDIAQLEVNAIISNDDVDGQMWAQVASAIKRAAGEGVERLAQEGKPFRLGQAWWTSAGALQHLHGIIHVASLSRNGASRIETVHECLAAALRLAAHKECESIGVAAIGSGPAAIPPEKWYRAFAKTAIDHFHDADPKLQAAPRLAIVLVLFEPDSFEAELELLRRAIWDAWGEAERPPTGIPEVTFEDERRSRAAEVWQRWRSRRSTATGGPGLEPG